VCGTFPADRQLRAERVQEVRGVEHLSRRGGAAYLRAAVEEPPGRLGAEWRRDGVSAGYISSASPVHRTCSSAPKPRSGQIAVRCGMGTATTLRRHFHRTVGVSPTAYRTAFRG
jgi:AraC-like DNA-binding protein